MNGNGQGREIDTKILKSVQIKLLKYASETILKANRGLLEPLIPFGEEEWAKREEKEERKQSST